MPPVEPGIRCMLRKTNGEAILSVLPVRRPATMTVVFAPMSWVRRCGALKYIRFFFCSINRVGGWEKRRFFEVGFLELDILNVEVFGLILFK